MYTKNKIYRPLKNSEKSDFVIGESKNWNFFFVVRKTLVYNMRRYKL